MYVYLIIFFHTVKKKFSNTFQNTRVPLQKFPFEK